MDSTNSPLPFFDDCVSDLAMPEGWEDVSYGNDSCPSWAFKGFQIFINHADWKKREDGVEDESRFWIIREVDYGGSSWSASADTFDDVLKIINDEETYHAVARAFMDMHSKPDFKKLSLDEWLWEYGDTLKYDDYRDEGEAIMGLFDATPISDGAIVDE